jgi:hypothetical protein
MNEKYGKSTYAKRKDVAHPVDPRGTGFYFAEEATESHAHAEEHEPEGCA